MPWRTLLVQLQLHLIGDKTFLFSDLPVQAVNIADFQNALQLQYMTLLQRVTAGTG